MAPEMREKAQVGTAIDMWSYGILLYEMAVAYKPTSVKNFKYGE